MVTIGDIMLGDDLGPVKAAKNMSATITVPKKALQKANRRYPVTLQLIGVAAAILAVITLFELQIL